MERQTQSNARQVDAAPIVDAERCDPLFLAGVLLISAIPLAAGVIVVLGIVLGWSPAQLPRIVTGGALILLGAYAGAVSAANQFLTLHWCWVVPALLVVAAGFVVAVSAFIGA